MDQGTEFGTGIKAKLNTNHGVLVGKGKENDNGMTMYCTLSYAFLYCLHLYISPYYLYHMGLGTEFR